MVAMLDHEDVLRLVGRIGEAALDYRCWEPLVRDIARAAGASTATLDLVDLTSGAVDMINPLALDPAYVQEYAERIYAINPRLAGIDEMPVCTIHADRHIPRDIDTTASEYYDWMRRGPNMRYFAASKLLHTRRDLAMFSLHNEERRGHFEQPDETLLSTLAPHIANALSVQLALARAEEKRCIADQQACHGTLAFALLAANGRITDCSESFERLIADSGILTIDAGMLGSAIPNDRAALQRFIAAAVAPSPAETPPLLRIDRPLRHGLVLRSIRLGRGDHLFASLCPVAMLMVTDLDAPAQIHIAELQAVWGLTPREAAIAQMIGQGMTIGGIALTLNISLHTARQHLKALFRRTDTDRQTDLALLVSKLRH